MCTLLNEWVERMCVWEKAKSGENKATATAAETTVIPKVEPNRIVNRGRNQMTLNMNERRMKTIYVYNFPFITVSSSSSLLLLTTTTTTTYGMRKISPLKRLAGEITPSLRARERERELE